MTSCAQISNNCVVQKPVQNKRVKQIKKNLKKQKQIQNINIIVWTKKT